MRQWGQRLQIVLLVVLGTALVTAATALAQGATPAATPVVVPPPDSAQALYVSLILAATPLVIALVKWLAPRVPKVALPIAAPFVGMLVTVIANYSTGNSLSPMTAALVGLAGVGVREAYDQLSQRWKADGPSTAQTAGG
jgi:hypothetical protein